MTYADLSLTAKSDPGLSRIVAAALFVWAGTVAWASSTGVFVSFPLPFFAGIVAALLIATVGLYVLNSRLQAGVERFGMRKLTALHVWRIPAAFAFYYYGSQGLLPPTFVLLAGTGDLIAGVLALYVVTAQSTSKKAFIGFHVVGMTDFIVAVGTGLTFSLMSNARMETIALFPLALIPLFGVTLSGATHIAAFDLLRKNKGLPKTAGS